MLRGRLLAVFWKESLLSTNGGLRPLAQVVVNDKLHNITGEPCLRQLLRCFSNISPRPRVCLAHRLFEVFFVCVSHSASKSLNLIPLQGLQSRVNNVNNSIELILHLSVPSPFFDLRTELTANPMSECVPLCRPTWVQGVIPVTGALSSLRITV